MYICLEFCYRILTDCNNFFVFFFVFFLFFLFDNFSSNLSRKPQSQKITIKISAAIQKTFMRIKITPTTLLSYVGFNGLSWINTSPPITVNKKKKKSQGQKIKKEEKKRKTKKLYTHLSTSSRMMK